MEKSTVAEIVRPHGDDHIDRDIGLRDAGEQEADKGIRLVGGDAVAIAEDLLKLVDDDQQVCAFESLGPSDELDQAERTAPERRFDEGRRFRSWYDRRPI